MTQYQNVTPEEARFTVRFAYTSDLLRDWQRHPVRTSRKIVRIIRPIMGVALILVGLWNLWLMGRRICTIEQYLGFRFSFLDRVSYLGWELLLPLLCLVVGVLEFFINRIRLNRSLKRMQKELGPEPWPAEYRFGADRFTISQADTSTSMVYSRIARVGETKDFVLLRVGKNLFRLPKYAFVQGTPQELVTFLRTKIPAKR
jgi:hypothetical protein